MTFPPLSPDGLRWRVFDHPRLAPDVRVEITAQPIPGGDRQRVVIVVEGVDPYDGDAILAAIGEVVWRRVPLTADPAPAKEP